jgi:hypothetical protein
MGRQLSEAGVYAAPSVTTRSSRSPQYDQLLPRQTWNCGTRASIGAGAIARHESVLVRSGTRKARAISPTVSPPSVRRVSATCASTESAG